MSLAARAIRAFADANLSPDALSANLARIARKARDDAIRAGEASPQYRTVVDRVEGRSEDLVRPDGKILYLFDTIAAAAAFGLAEARRRSRILSGDFQSAWMVAVDGQRWTAELRDIPPGAKVMIVNPLPYSRRLDQGRRQVRSRRGDALVSRPLAFTEKVRQAVRLRFPDLDVQRIFVALPAAFQFGTYEVPYKLKSGKMMTYPAVSIEVKA